MNLSDNLLFQFLSTFWAGVLVSFTPCVYPLMPITATAITGLNVKGSKLGGFVISCIYVLGMAVMYCISALVAIFTGKIFGFVQNSPITFLVTGNILLIFALTMFDVIPLPYLGLNIQNNVKVNNLWAVFVLGLTTGLIVGPCTAPVLGSLLTFVASKKNMFLGISLLFVFSYGVGASLILIGTFSNLLVHLPKSGKWLVWVKRLCGVILLLGAEYLFLKAGGLME